MTAEWNGVTESGVLSEDIEKVIHLLIRSSQEGKWKEVLTILHNRPELVNCTRPGDHSLNTALHHAAYCGAEPDVVAELLQFGAWRILRNARGERPADVAMRNGNRNLYEQLTPVYGREVPTGVLLAIQSHFHQVIKGRFVDLVNRPTLRLPELEVLLELDIPEMWFPVPGMYGGFKFWLESEGEGAELISESWCRAVSGSGQRHSVTATGWKMIEQGFV